jgi:hypothetical protein
MPMRLAVHIEPVQSDAVSDRTSRAFHSSRKGSPSATRDAFIGCAQTCDRLPSDATDARGLTFPKNLTFNADRQLCGATIGTRCIAKSPRADARRRFVLLSRKRSPFARIVVIRWQPSVGQVRPEGDVGLAESTFIRTACYWPNSFLYRTADFGIVTGTVGSSL